MHIHPQRQALWEASSYLQPNATTVFIFIFSICKKVPEPAELLWCLLCVKSRAKWQHCSNDSLHSSSREWHTPQAWILAQASFHIQQHVSCTVTPCGHSGEMHVTLHTSQSDPVCDSQRGNKVHAAVSYFPWMCIWSIQPKYEVLL